MLNASRLVGNEELAEMRAGFFTAAGAKFDFGASVQTLVNGALALQTNLQWTPAGPVTQQLQGLGASISAQVASDLAKAGITTSGTPTPASNAIAADLPATGAPASPAAAGTDITAPTNVPASLPVAPDTAPALITGVQIPGVTGGSTQVFANIGPGQIQNVVLNSASGQEITQNTNVTLTIYNFTAWQQQVAQRAVSAQLVNDMLAASGINAGH